MPCRLPHPMQAPLLRPDVFGAQTTPLVLQRNTGNQRPCKLCFTKRPNYSHIGQDRVHNDLVSSARSWPIKVPRPSGHQVIARHIGWGRADAEQTPSLDESNLWMARSQLSQVGSEWSWSGSAYVTSTDSSSLMAPSDVDAQDRYDRPRHVPMFAAGKPGNKAATPIWDQEIGVGAPADKEELCLPELGSFHH